MTLTDTELRKALDTMRIWISEDAHLGESTISYELERAEGLRKLDAIEQAIAATVGVGTCHLEECEHEREIPYDLPECDGGWYTEVTHDCDECGYENVDPNIRFCGGCGRRVVSE